MRVKLPNIRPKFNPIRITVHGAAETKFAEHILNAASVFIAGILGRTFGFHAKNSPHMLMNRCPG